MNSERKFVGLLDRARRGAETEQLRLRVDDGDLFAQLECTYLDLANDDLWDNDCPLDKGQREVLMMMIEERKFSAPKGRPEYTPGTVEFGMMCVNHLVAVGKQAHCEASGRQRIRGPEIVRGNNDVLRKLKERAISLLRPVCPQLEGLGPRDLTDARPNRTVIAWINEHLPQGERRMQEFAPGPGKTGATPAAPQGVDPPLTRQGCW